MPYTNVTIRKKLGELGFIEDRDTRNVTTTQTSSVWKRTGNQRIVLYESSRSAPVVTDGATAIDVDSIPVLNVNLQNDGIGE